MFPSSFLSPHALPLRDKLRMRKLPDKDRCELLGQLEEARIKATRDTRYHGAPRDTSPPTVAPPRAVSPRVIVKSGNSGCGSTTSAGSGSGSERGSSSDRGSTPPRSGGKKRTAPQPPLPAKSPQAVQQQQQCVEVINLSLQCYLDTASQNYP